jgi:pilus assembly protein Flp/PilA
MLKRFLTDESGATAIEYALLAALLSLAVIASVSLLGGELKTSFENTATEVSGVVP